MCTTRQHRRACGLALCIILTSFVLAAAQVTVHRVRGVQPGPGMGQEDPVACAEEYLRQHPDWPGLASLVGDLMLLERRQSLGSSHVRYQQVVEGAPVLGTHLSLHFTPGGQLLWADSRLTAAGPVGTWILTPQEALLRARQGLEEGNELPWGGQEARGVWRHDGAVLRPTWLVQTSTMAPPRRLEVLVDGETGAVLRERNRLRYVNGTGQVFMPNPVQYLQDPGLTDQGDACYPAMLAALVPVTLERLDGTGFLDGQFCSTMFTSAMTRAYEPTLAFNYCRDTSFFSEVMAYHHIDQRQEWIQSLGFTSILNRQQIVDAYFPFGVAFFDPMMKVIALGTEQVDAAEDAEVIIHEYGHAVQDDQIPGLMMNSETGALGEGFGDYQAESTYTAGPGSFQYGWVGDWVRLGTRSTRTAKTYPASMRYENPHQDGQIWSATLFDIFEQLGRSITDTLVLESHFLLAPDAPITDAAEALLQADQTVHGGAHRTALEGILRGRGVLVEEDGFEPNDSQAAAAPITCGGNGILLLEGGDEDWFSVDLTGAGGWITFTCFGPYDATGSVPSAEARVAITGPGGPIATTSPVLAAPLDLSAPPMQPGGIKELTCEVADLVGAPPGRYHARVYSPGGDRCIYTISYAEQDPGAGGFVGLCGDCNQDGVRNIVDALSAAQVATGLGAAPDPVACDVNSSGSIEIVDALVMAQHSAGLTVTLRCGGGGFCSTGSVMPLQCGQSHGGSLTAGTTETLVDLSLPSGAHHFALLEVPVGTTSVTLSLSGTGDLDLLVGAPGTLPGSPHLRHVTQASAHTGTSTETLTLSGSALGQYHGGPVPVAVGARDPGTYTLTVTCN